MATTVAAAPEVVAERKGAVKWIRINRPQVKNAITPDVADAVREEVEKATTEGARVIVLAGAGGAFCSGADLKAVGPRLGENVSVRDVLVNHYHPLVLAMTRSPLPVIAAVDGAAAGIGCDIALAADIRLVSDRAFFAEIFVNINLMPDGGGSFTLSRLVGSGRALEMAMTGCRVPAADAERWGMANHVYPTDQFEENVQQFAAHLAEKAPLSIAQSKAAIRANLGNATFEQALAREADTQQKLVETHDFPEGVMAFLAKRKPNFLGK
ncbi:MAG: enoyl-CoA hydratase/isomerase family protein [Planctomycetia bacterium]|nr:enoyl-CoA hydratase/isomerase family protein [Planctomycetia bacterium]